MMRTGTIFTDAAYALIRAWVAENVPAEHIAQRLGCKVSSLRVQCCHKKISLRTPDWAERRKKKMNPEPIIPKPKPLPQHKPLILPLSRVALSLLRQRAERECVTIDALATTLLEAIARTEPEQIAA